MKLDELARVKEMSVLFTGSKTERVEEHTAGIKNVWKNGGSNNFGVVASQIDRLCFVV